MKQKNHINKKILLPQQKEPNILVIITKLNGLNSSIKRQRPSDSIETAITHSRCMLFIRDTVKTKQKVRNERLKNIYQMFSKKKKATKAIIISNKVSASVKIYQRNKEHTSYS